MNYEILEALGQIAREKNVGKDLVIETLEAGIVSAARRKYGQSADIRVKFDEKSATMEVQYVRKVVDDLSDEEREIEFDDARSVDPKVKIGDELVVALAFEEFGRGAIQAAKQVVVQRVREAEREIVYQNYHNRIGEIVTGTVQQINRGNIIVNLGRAEALLPFREQIRREQYRQGDTIRALIVEVQKNAKGPQIILSRASEEFLMKLFQQEVPEILEGIVQIRAVAREAGGRSKIGVSSNEYRVDPVGACVGMKGSRVQGIVRELSGERIDIVPYSEDPIAFVTKALSPAKILQVVSDEPNKTMQVVVTEDQLSLAIGKGGQNARLAAKLTGWKIDLISEAEFAAQRGETSRAHAVPVEELAGLGPKTIENLVRAGFESVQDIVKASIEDLINVPGVGDVTAQKIYLAAVQHIEAVEEAKKQEAENAKREAAMASAAASSAAAEELAPAVEWTLPPAAVEEVAAREVAAQEAAAPPAPVESKKTEPKLSDQEREAAPSAVPVKASSEADAGPPAGTPSPRPSAPERPDGYLDEIEAMESELLKNWEAGGEGEESDRT
jgi:N utilization substance protein A